MDYWNRLNAIKFSKGATACYGNLRVPALVSDLLVGRNLQSQQYRTLRLSGGVVPPVTSGQKNVEVFEVLLPCQLVEPKTPINSTTVLPFGNQ